MPASLRAGLVGLARRQTEAAVGRPSSRTGLFLGVAALFYSLLLGYAAFTLAIMALLRGPPYAPGAWRAAIEPLLRLLVIAAISGAMWLIGLVAVAAGAVKGGSPAAPARAQHYLPDGGRTLDFRCCTSPCSAHCACSARSGWCARAPRRGARRRLAVAVLAVYVWSLLSMLTTCARHAPCCRSGCEPPLTVLLAAAGAFGFIEVAAGDRAPVPARNPRR